MSREVEARLRIQRENEDSGLRECLSTPNGRAFLWWLYKQCAMRDNLTLLRADGELAAMMTARQIGKQIPGRELENRCKLVNHRDWLLVLAENDVAVDDGRRQDQRQDEAGGEGW